MARKKNNTILWVAGLGLGYFLYTKYKDGTLNIPGVTPAVPANNTVPNASGGVLSLPPSPTINTNVPQGAPVSNAPNVNAVNVTGLVPATISPAGSVQLNPGQTLALNANQMPITNSAGIPLVFPAPSYGKPSYLSLLSGPIEQFGECL